MSDKGISETAVAWTGTTVVASDTTNTIQSGVAEDVIRDLQDAMHSSRCRPLSSRGMDTGSPAMDFRQTSY